MIIKHFDDLGFSVVAEPDEYSVEYKIYARFDAVASDGTPLPFQRKDSTSHPDPVATIDEAEIFISGHVKWDHCSNWTFDESERCCIHFCERDKIKNISLILEACYDWTAELLTTWDKA